MLLHIVTPDDDVLGAGFHEESVCCDEPLSLWMAEYCEGDDRDVATACFVHAGVVLDGTKTPSQLGLAEFSQIVELCGLAESVFDKVSERCVDAGVLSEAEIDELTDRIAGERDKRSGLVPSAMLGHVQSLYVLLALHRGSGHIGPTDDGYCGTNQLTYAEAVLRETLRRNKEAVAWCALLLSLLSGLETPAYVQRKALSMRIAMDGVIEDRCMQDQHAQQAARDKIERLRRQEAAVAKCIEIREAAAQVRAAIAARLGDDPAQHIERLLAAVRIQAAGRGLKVRRKAGINLTIVTQDGNEIFFRMNTTTPLGQLMNAFSQRTGVSVDSVRFLFDGFRIYDYQTPRELDMEDGDIIDVMVEQMGD
mmetsp:Transcript_57526/g.157978  ORF Transcript_57526/g.157978 Transcript_57526/m.157978 type:complete len:365 (+) Transcript_57526:1594-2688(+)